MKTALQIYAMGGHYHQIETSLPDMKELAQQITEKSFRRIGRFIQLAMIGAARCTNLSVPADTAVYLASGRGDLETTLDIMKELFAHGQTPKPLAFVNTVSNAACFYVAQLLKLQSRSNYVCNRYFAFESILQLAVTDLLIGTTSSTLIGSIDVVTQPVNEHRQRLQLPPDSPLGEGTHWLWIGKQNAQRPRLGEIIAAEHFASRDALLAWTQSHSSSSMALSCGQFVSDIEWTLLQSAIAHHTLFDYRNNRGYYDSQSGAAIGEFLCSNCKANTLMHINANADGEYSVIVARR